MPARRGFKLEHRCDGLHDLARTIRLQRDIGPGGLLIANPIPHDHALEEAVIEARIAEAVAEAKMQGVGKKEATPFLLKRVVELTGGQSLDGQYRAHQEQRHARRTDGGGDWRSSEGGLVGARAKAF